MDRPWFIGNYDSVMSLWVSACQEKSGSQTYFYIHLMPMDGPAQLEFVFLFLRLCVHQARGSMTTTFLAVVLHSSVFSQGLLTGLLNLSLQP